MAHKKKSPPAATGELGNCHRRAASDVSQHNKLLPRLQQIPARAVLARRFPRLKINRLSWRWVDDANGAKGDNVVSLLAFINGGTQ